MIRAGSGRSSPRQLRRACCSLAGVLSVALVAIPRAALADSSLSNDGNSVSYDPGPAKRRDGFVLGLGQHMGLVSMSGYPNRLAAIGNPAERTSTGAELGQTGGLWIGGALRDWLTVGVGLSGAATLGSGATGATSAFVLHLEGFPAFSLGGLYRDLGVALDVGTGFGQIRRDDDVLADGGSLAHFGGGVFFEPLRFWHFSTGPSLSYSHQFSQTLSSHVVGLGWRLVFYGVQPKDSAQSAR